MEFFTITKDDVSYCLSSYSYNNYSVYCSLLKVPNARLIDMAEDMKKFVPDFVGFNPEEVQAFLDSFLSGDLKVREYKTIDY